MQLNKLLKSLILALPVIAVAACSSHKFNNNDQTNDVSIEDDSSSPINKSNISVDENARLQIEAIERKNIIYFGLDKYEIESKFAQILDMHANFLRNNLSYKVTIEGHADERGTPEYNIALGERRATAVKMYLQGKGVSTNQISIVSYGKEKPAVLGHNEADYAKNRRAVLVY